MPPDRRSDTLTCDSVRAQGSQSATFTLFGPLFPRAARVWESLWLTVTSTTAPATDVWSIQPFYLIGGSRYPVGGAVVTNVAGRGAVTLNVPFRCHSEEFLNFKVPPGAMLGVTATRTSGGLSSPCFHFVTYGG